MRGIVAFLMLITLTGQASAQSDIGDVRDGRRIADAWCANCHRVAPDGPGPATDAAPGFAAVAAMNSTTPMSLRVFLQSPHRNMPNFQLSRAETDNLIAYILSLRAR